MNIIEIPLVFEGGLQARSKTEKIILHHRAGFGDILSIHKDHIKKGWAGIGYHFYVRCDGSIYRGRPIETMGAHCQGKNTESIGICFEGDFTKESMGKEQLEAGRKLLAYLEEIYGKDFRIYKHSDFSVTECPGDKFPFDEILKVSEDELVNTMYKDGIITFKNVINWELFLSGKAKVKADYLRAIIRRYQKKLIEK